MDKKNNASEFIERLSQDENLRKEIGPSLLQINPGDWSGIIKVAKGYGFSFTKKELLAALPDSFFKGKGKNPDVGWDESTKKA